MPALKPDHVFVTPAEDAAITAAAMSDPDAMPLTDEEWERVQPFVRVGAAHPVGRPNVDEHKSKTSMQVDADVLAALRNTGRGRQTRMNAVLRETVENGRV